MATLCHLDRYSAKTLAVAGLLLCWQPPLIAQQRPANSQVEHGREFLGLGPAPDAAAAERGRKLFVQTCGFCHGSSATGAEGPNLVRSTVVLHDEKGELIGPVVTKGRPQRGMPAFSAMTSDQTYDLAEFLHARVEAAANRYGYKLTDVVMGDPKAGQLFFDNTGHCGQCHSTTGDLAHVAKRFEPADLQAQFLYPASSVSAMAVVTLPSGETIKGKLKRVDDFTISLWEDSGQYRSWARSAVKVKIEEPLQGHRELLARYANSDMHNVLAYLETLK